MALVLGAQKHCARGHVIIDEVISREAPADYFNRRFGLEQ